MKHTQGPWKVHEWLYQDDGRAGPMRVESEEQTVAEIFWPYYCTDTSHGRAELLANAALIAAAPEMADVLARAAKWGIGFAETILKTPPWLDDALGLLSKLDGLEEVSHV